LTGLEQTTGHDRRPDRRLTRRVARPVSPGGPPPKTGPQPEPAPAPDERAPPPASQQRGDKQTGEVQRTAAGPPRSPAGTPYRVGFPPGLPPTSSYTASKRNQTGRPFPSTGPNRDNVRRLDISAYGLVTPPGSAYCFSQPAKGGQPRRRGCRGAPHFQPPVF